MSSSHISIRALLIAIGLCASLAACGASASKTSMTTASSAATQASLVEVSGIPTVFSDDYPLTGHTGYETAVIFEAKNSGSKSVVNQHFKVRLLGPNSAVLATSDGNDVFSLDSGVVQPVVFTTSAVEDVKPTSAEVTLYPSQIQAAQAQHVARSSDWVVTGATVDCPSGIVECQFTADATYGGRDPQTTPSAAVLVHQGDKSGPVVGAGQAFDHSNPISIAPHTQVPISDNTVVIDSAHMADKNLFAEVFIQSLAAPGGP